MWPCQTFHVRVGSGHSSLDPQSCTAKSFYPLSHFPAFPHRFRLLISRQGLTKLPELDFDSLCCATGLKVVSLLFQPLKLLCHQPWPIETTLKCRIQ